MVLIIHFTVSRKNSDGAFYDQSTHLTIKADTNIFGCVEN